MKSTDFATHLSRYFTNYLPGEKGSSPQTIDSYRYAFILFLEYVETNGMKAEKLKIKDFNREIILGFLEWLEIERGNSPSTRNGRLAAMKGFVHYLKYEFPDYLSEYQKILAIPLKKTRQPEISYLKKDGVKLLVNQIDLNDKNGLRDYCMVMLLYTTGVRVSELINARVKDLSLSAPYTMLVHGKGGKSRYVPLAKTSIEYIRKYLSKMGYDKEIMYDEFLFKNHLNKQFTRQGIAYILKKYGNLARAEDSSLVPSDLSPHKMRHTTAMELLASGVELIYIRDLLGHSSITTTEIYAKADAQLKLKAIEAASKEIVPSSEAKWEKDKNLKEWLKNFNRQ